MISLGNIGSHDMPDTEEASTMERKNEKESKSIIEFTRHSSLTLGRMRLRDVFLRGSRGPCAPGPFLLTLTFLSFSPSFSNLNSNFPNFSRKKKVFQKSYYLFPSYRVFSSLIFRCRVISVYFWIERIMEQKSVLTMADALRKRLFKAWH